MLFGVRALFSSESARLCSAQIAVSLSSGLQSGVDTMLISTLIPPFLRIACRHHAASMANAQIRSMWRRVAQITSMWRRVDNRGTPISDLLIQRVECELEQCADGLLALGWRRARLSHLDQRSACNTPLAAAAPSRSVHTGSHRAHE